MTDDIRKLLGGYATGTLTEEERQVLYSAALVDQTLFEALADEQVLKELLEDPAARAQLLQAAATPHFSLVGVVREWFERPKSKVLVALGAALFLTIAVRETMWDGKARSTTPSTVAVLLPEAKRDAAPAPLLQHEADSPRRVEVSRQPRAGVAAPLRDKKETQQAALNEAAVPPAAPAPPAPALEAADRALPLAKQASAPDSATKIARSGEIEMKYTVLLRNPEGEYLPVSSDHAFDSNDHVRLRVEVNRDGMVGMTGHDGKRVYVSNVAAASAVTLPHEIEFAQIASHDIEISFAQISATAGGEPAMGFTSMRQEARKSADERSNAVRPRAAVGAAAAIAPAEPQALAVRLNLRRKP